jgi:hypothetical protein
MMQRWRKRDLERARESGNNRDRFRRWMVAFAAAICCLTGVPSAHAQHPLCPAPNPTDVYYVYCSPYAQGLVENFLYDFSVSQLFKSPRSFNLPTDLVIDSMGFGNLLFSTDEDRQKTLAERPTVEFHPFDALGSDLAGRGYSSSGEFISTGLAGPPSLQTVDSVTGVRVKIEIPEVLQGLYWRSPAHLEMQFYPGHSLRYLVGGSDAAASPDTIVCVSITRSGARATTADPTHQLLSRFGACK